MASVLEQDGDVLGNIDTGEGFGAVASDDGRDDRVRWLVPWGFALGAAAFVGWIIDKVLPDNVTLTSSTAAIILATTFFAFVGMALHFIQARPSAELARPRVLLFKPEQGGLFLISPADWLTYRTGYSLFVTEKDGFERLLGTAQVFVIQDDKKVQLLVARRAEGAEIIWKNLDDGSTDHFKKIIVKPGAPILGD